eukprot:1138789-Pelagomonas_calceolata.AAC.2
MKIENVDKVMDEINESNEQMSQINDVMANPIGGARDIDEDELNEELEMLEVGAITTACAGLRCLVWWMHSVAHGGKVREIDVP